MRFAVALAGAVVTLAEAGYRFPRIAGTSAGAIVGAVLAALQRRGEPLTGLTEVARTHGLSAASVSRLMARLSGTGRHVRAGKLLDRGRANPLGHPFQRGEVVVAEELERQFRRIVDRAWPTRPSA